MSANTLNSHADKGFLIDRFPLHLDVVTKFHNRYREFESLPLRQGVCRLQRFSGPTLPIPQGLIPNFFYPSAGFFVRDYCAGEGAAGGACAQHRLKPCRGTPFNL
jgi:hypothetical protein